MNELIGKKIIVYSDSGGTERQDIGHLVSVDQTWVCIKKSDHDFQYFSCHKIRLIKAFDS
jgi:hypothetical protein